MLNLGVNTYTSSSNLTMQCIFFFISLIVPFFSYTENPGPNILNMFTFYSVLLFLTSLLITWAIFLGPYCLKVLCKYQCYQLRAHC